MQTGKLAFVVFMVFKLLYSVYDGTYVDVRSAHILHAVRQRTEIRVYLVS